MAEPEQVRVMPIITPEHYLVPVDSRSVTPETKKAFLEIFYQSGNKSQAAKMAGLAVSSIHDAVKADKGFAKDYYAVMGAMKHNLEQTMYQNGLKEKGYMDRITWLRKNYPKEYNPNYVDKDNNPAEAIKELSSSLKEYQLIPKKQIIDVEEKDNAS